MTSVARVLLAALLGVAPACGDDSSSTTDGGSRPADQRVGVLGRVTEAVSFTHKDQPFAGFKYDTGWQPSGSGVQVRLYVTENTLVQSTLPGTAELVRTKDGLDLAYIGKSNGGTFQMDLGFQLTCRMKIDVSVYGVPVKWEGDVPLLVPQWDFRFADKKTFTPFVLQGGSPRPIHLADTIQKRELYRVPLPGLSIPHVGGGEVVIRAAGQLNVDLSGQSISTAIVGGSTLSHTREGQTVAWPDRGRSTEEADASYSANVKYSGSIILYPTVTISILSKGFDVAEFPITIDLSRFGQLSYTWSFNQQHLTFNVPGAGGG
jgi:hypothetical protein